MAGKTKSDIAQLKAQAEEITSVFAQEGFMQIEPDIMQPADIFLEKIGEGLRARTYVFSDLEGEALCLRPDLTVPAARYYLSHIETEGLEARYQYIGPAFRFQSSDVRETQPREFEQAGIELFGSQNSDRDDAQVLALSLKAIEASGLSAYRVKTGDLGLFCRIIDELDMPAHWAGNLKAKFWRPTMFKKLLEKLSTQAREELPSFAAELPNLNEGEAVLRVEQELDTAGLPAHGLRSVSEIAARLREKALDATLAPLSREMCGFISEYLNIECALEDAPARISELNQKSDVDMTPYAELLKRRISALKEAGVALERCSFSAEFGRNLEYYSGFVFQVEAEGVPGLAGQIAGGGRYDGLLADIGAQSTIPAVGCALHTERLLAAVKLAGGDNV